MKATVLAGGVGGARLSLALAEALPALDVVVNTGDDFVLHGLTVCPDLDSVLYTLAGWSNRVQGWGLEPESWRCMEQLAQLGGDAWFRLGDRDLATHLLRTGRLSQGQRLTEITASLTAAAGVHARLLPMADTAVPTRVRVAEGWLEFQDYFVRRQGRDRVLELRYQGAESTPPSPDVVAAVRDAERLILAPSNPFLSLSPIFALQGFAELWQASTARKVALSPMVGETAVKGPLASLLADHDLPVNSLGVARVLRPWIEALVIHESDLALADPIRELGLVVELCDTMLTEAHQRAVVAELLLRV